MSAPLLDEVQDAILAEIYAAQPAHLTIIEDIALKSRLLAILQAGESDPAEMNRLFREAMDGA
jgi:hypothetical protein